MHHIQAYIRLARLDRPVGIFLCLWPTLWGLWFASPNPPWRYVLVFIAGVILMRSAGCAFNDFADRHIDAKVWRTKRRPLVTGELKPKEALLFGLALSLLAFIMVMAVLPWQAVLLALPALGIALTYPYSKRFFPLPQAYLGIAFGFGIPMAFVAIQHAIPPLAWLLLFANIFWAIAYDTAYAMVDKEDDAKLGIHSSTFLFGRYDIVAILCCYAAFFFLLWYCGHLLALNHWYNLGILAALLVSMRHYFLLRARQPALAFRVFLENQWTGGLIFLGLLLARLI
jgi:4-hydroxybenzoate polyprenyltransferase